ncbi:MAG: hypothetical protein O3C32_08325, partial [Bacteroidetes bacterium]|nr:hypothetical protein [Bacteroidota bacterium]
GTLDTASILMPATGLLIFNTANAGLGITAVHPGYYYNAGIQQTSNPNAIHIGETGYWSSTEKWGSSEAWWLWFGEGRILKSIKTGTYSL